MKTLSIILLLIGSSIWLTAQTRNIPDVDLKTLDGMSVKSSEILDSDAPTIVFFWKSDCNDCTDNLESMQDAWQGKLQQEGVKMVAVCTDCHGSWGHVKPMAYGKNWEFEIYIDPNGDFKRTMNISDTPCTMLFDEDHNLLGRQTGYCSESEELICEKVIQSLNQPSVNIQVR
nr:TlpA family protein disulfide reductase [Bacteroidota bacterium]